MCLAPAQRPGAEQHCAWRCKPMPRWQCQDCRRSDASASAVPAAEGRAVSAMGLSAALAPRQLLLLNASLGVLCAQQRLGGDSRGDKAALGRSDKRLPLSLPQAKPGSELLFALINLCCSGTSGGQEGRELA